ncbi:MAG: hypothetical protein R3A44_23595 [Caldilineaceae bacterium]
MQRMHLFVRDAAPLLATLVIAVYVVYRLIILIRQQRLSSGGYFAMASLTTAQALLLLVDVMTPTVDHGGGLHNLSWLLGYALATFASLLGGFLSCGYVSFTPSRVGLKYLWTGLLALECAMLLIFVIHLLHTPTWMPQIPRAAIAVLFSLSFFGYALMVATVGLATVITAVQGGGRGAS